MKAKKGAPKKSPMLMVAGIALAVILVIGGYIFLHNQQPAGPGANQQTGTSNIPQPEQPEKTPAPQAQTNLNPTNPILEAKAEFDAAAGAQNRGDLQGALKKFQAIAGKPGTYQLEAQARIPKLNEMINNAGAQQEFNAALQTENSGNRQGALEQFKAIAEKGGPFKADAQTHIQQLNDQLNAAAAGQQFDAAAKVQNSGDLNGALALFKALAANPGPRQNDAQQRVQSITDQITQQEAQQQFNAAVQAQNNGDLKAALAQFKAIASKPSPLQPLAQAKADLIAQLLKSSPPPNPAPSNPAPPNPAGTTPTTTAGRNPVVTPLYSGGLVPLTLPYHKGMIVSDVNVDGGLKAMNLAMPPVQGAPTGSLVLIMIKIDENGSVSPQRVINDTSGFGPQVQEAARAWKFNPPTAKGKPVNTTLTVKVTF
jgi:TonB family protein